MDLQEIPKDLGVLIIGTGGAGCAAALEAKKRVDNVQMITKGIFLDSKTAYAQGGIQASIGESDSPEHHIEDTLKAGEYQNNRKLVEILSYKAFEAVQWLENLGVVFDKDGDDYYLQNAGGLSHPRILSCGDKSGNRLMSPIRKAILDNNINVAEYITINDVEAKDGYYLVNLMNVITGESSSHRVKSLIIATGGFIPEDMQSGLSQKTQFKALNTFDLAKMIGLKLVKQDLVQYHPTGIISPKALRRSRIPETVRSAGASLLNKDLKEFCNSLDTRNNLTKRIIKECKDGKGIPTDDGRVGVWLNTPIIDEINGKGFLAKKFPSLYKSFFNLGLDIAENNVLIYPILHYSLGGIIIDENTSTNKTGIFAVGEATYGVHGNDRLMGNSLLEIFVFGRISGEKAAEFILENN